MRLIDVDVNVNNTQELEARRDENTGINGRRRVGEIKLEEELVF
jgi:hypothetical protein